MPPGRVRDAPLETQKCRRSRGASARAVSYDTAYLVWADLPGVKKEDISVAIAGAQVTLTAEVKEEKAVDQGQGQDAFLVRERRTGTLFREMQFAAEIDDAKAQAQFRDGVLRVTLWKKESSQVKRLSIH